VDEPVSIGWRLVEIGDALLREGGGIDGEMRAPDEPLVTTDRPEFVPVGKRKTLGD